MKDLISSIFGWCILLFLISGCGYFIYDVTKRINKEPTSYITCSKMIYFNRDIKELSDLYTQVIIKSDTILSFKDENGDDIKRTNFIDGGYIDANKSEIILNNGMHYDFEIIWSGKCETDRVMDSVMNSDEDN